MIGRGRILIAAAAAWAVIAALLSMPPAHALAQRFPADAANVSTVPVLSWPAVVEAVSYQLQVSKTASFSTVIVDQTRETPAYTFADDLAPGTYYWRYRGIRSDESLMAPSAAWTFTRTSQDAPVLVSPADDAALLYPVDSPTLRWEPVPSFGRYTLQWDDNPEFRSPREADSIGTSFTLPTLQPQDRQKIIYWRVRATATKLDTVETAWSSARKFTIRWADSSKPVLVSPANGDVMDQPAFTWEPTPGAAKYELQIGRDEDFTTLVHPDTGVDYASTPTEEPFLVDSNSYVPGSRYPAKAHWWRVRALDANGSPGPWSHESSDTKNPPWQFTRRWTQLDEAVGSPSNDRAGRPDNVVLNPAVPLNEFLMKWDPVPDTTFYEVEVSTDPAFHDGSQRTICRTPQNSFAPAYQGHYIDAGREDDCPIIVPESALPPFYDANYQGAGTEVTIFGSGPSIGTTVLLYFGLGDPQNGMYVVKRTVTDNPDTTMVDESAFVITLTRPGNGRVKWRLQPALVLTPGETFYFRVRAVHETQAGRLLYSVWSDQANTPGGIAPGPAVTNPSEDRLGTTAVDKPAHLLSPDPETTSPDWPLLHWEPAEDAQAYLVAIAKDREFTNSALEDLGAGIHFEYYVTRNTYFIPQTTLAESTASGSYYWYVLPCLYYRSQGDNDCAVPDRDAILQTGRWGSFKKQSNALTSLSVEDSASEPTVTLSWDTPSASNSVGNGGFARYEVQITASTWARATTVVTETARFRTAGLDLEPSSIYRWRVRAIDGGLLPMPWADGTDFELPTFAGPAGMKVLDEEPAQPCLAWDAAPLAAGYDIEIFGGTDPEFPESARVFPERPSDPKATLDYPSYCPSGLAGGDYSWRVRSVHEQGGKSRWSSGPAFSVSVDQPVLVAPVPTAPDTTASITVRHLKFEWNHVHHAASYLVELSKDGFWTVFRTAPSVTTSWTPNDLEPGDYAWRVAALDALGNVLSTSQPVDVSISRLTVAEVEPTTGPTAGGTEVTITGTGFAPDATVSFGGNKAVVATPHSHTSMRVTTPAHAAGSVEIIVTNPDGESYAAPVPFRYLAPPTVTSFTPASGTTLGGTSVTITGSDFEPDATVSFGGSFAQVDKPHTSTSMTVKAPPHFAGLVDVIVANPDGQSDTAHTQYEYIAAPFITSFAPTTGTVDGGTRVTITGTDFDATATVTLDGSAATIVERKGTTSITITTAAHAPGRVDLLVTNPDGQSFKPTDKFTFVVPPSVTSFTPKSGSTRGGTSVEITGAGFDANAIVTVGGVRAEVTGRTGTTGITIATGPHAAGPVDLVVVNPDGQSASAGEQYVYVAPPAITGIKPASGPPEGGNSVEISGTGFSPQATVTFGGIAGRPTARTTTMLTITAPPNAAGPVEVVVTNPDGLQATASQKYTYVSPPKIRGVAPGSGPTSGYTSVVVVGTDFDKDAQVFFGGTAATVTARTSTSLTVLTPAHSAQSVDVTVSNPDGQKAVAPSAFTFVEGAQAVDGSGTPPWFVSPPRLTVSGTSLKVRWSRPSTLSSPADAYSVLIKRSSGAFKAVRTTTVRHVKLKVQRGRTYWVKIRAHSAAGWGDAGPAARRQVR